jgi:DNA polymerase-1
VEVNGPLYDTMLCHYLIEPEAAHDLEILSAQYLNYTLLKDGEAPVGDRLCERVDQIIKLKIELDSELKEKNAEKLFR